MAQCATCVPRLYKSVIEEVIANVRDAFLDEGIDDQVLQEVKQAWEQKLAATRATEHNDALAGTGQQSNASQQQQQQQLQQAAHQQVTSGLAGQTAAAAQPPPPPQVNLVPVQITVPAPQAGGTPKTITIHVPSTALANGVAGAQLQSILSAPSAAQTFALEANQAAEVIQRQLNASLQRRGITLPPQLLQFGSQPQVDGATDLPSAGGVCKARHRSKKLCRTSKRSSAADAEASTTIEREMDAEEPSLPGASRGAPDAATAGVTVSVNRDTLDQLLERRLASKQMDGGWDDSSDEMSGDDDDDEDDKEEEDEKDKKYGMEDEEEEDDAADVNEDPLNSADDLSDDEGGEAFDTYNVVVCQFDKVTRVRNKWKFSLKDGIMNLKGKDYVFLKATGEGEW